MASTVRDRVLKPIDGARRIIGKLGFRRYRFIVRQRYWALNGQPVEPGTRFASAVQLDFEITPQPKVRQLGDKEVNESGGTYEQGDFRIDKITPRYISGALHGGAFPKPTLNTPASVSVAVHGTAGTTGYDYVVVPFDGTAHCGMQSPAGLTLTGSAVLDSTNFNRVTWPTVPGATAYYVFRSLGGATQGRIGIATGTSFDDTGLTGDGSAAVAPVLQPSLSVGVTGHDVAHILIGDEGEIELTSVGPAAFDHNFTWSMTVGRKRIGAPRSFP